MVGENISALVLVFEAAIHFARQVQFLPEPQRHGLEKGSEAGRDIGEVGFEQTLEFQKRFVIERDKVEIGRANTALGKAIIDRVLRKAIVVLPAREALLLRGGNEVAIA